MAGATLKQRADEELRSYAAVSTYLFLCSSAVLPYTSAGLREEGVGFLPHGIAAIKALILGKFILIGEAVGVGDRARNGPTLIHTIAIKSLMFCLFLLLLSALEELLVGKLHGHSFSEILAEFREQSAFEQLARSLLLLLTLVPLIAVRELSEALGPGELRKLVRRDGTRSE